MSPSAECRLLIDRTDLHQARLVADPDAPAGRALAEGQARLAIDRFALTANNITYAAFGSAMKYWDFFPAPDPAFGCLPVWGFADVVESRLPGLEPGRRVYGYLPAGTHLVVEPASLSRSGFADAAPHRAALAAVYNRYTFCDADPGWQAEREGLQAVLRPLFTTSFLLEDFLAENDFFGARQVLLSSASSKTAFGTAFCMAARTGHPPVIGLTSAGNVAFTRALGCYDEVCEYGQVTRLDAAVPALYVDFAGNAALRSTIHHHFAVRLVYSSSIGGTHWSALGAGKDLPGPRPTLFFAPSQVQRRSAPPPEGWGRDGFATRLGDAWAAFIAGVEGSRPPWVRIVQRDGGDAMLASYLALLAGQADAGEGLMLRPRA